MSNILKIVLTFFILLFIYIGAVVWVIQDMILMPGDKVLILVMGLEVPIVTALIANWRNWDDKI